MKTSDQGLGIGDWGLGARGSGLGARESRLRLRGRATPRRGVLLLVVLGLLAMFGLVGLTFVMLANHEQRGAQAQSRADLYADPADDLVGQAMLQVLRGSNDPQSVLRTHSLLEDLYGLPYVNGLDDDGNGLIDDPNEARVWKYTIQAAPTQVVGGGQIIECPLLTNMAPAHMPMPAFSHGGCVVTMLDGPAAGRSFRIVGHNPTTGVPHLLITGGVAPIVGNTLLLNGTPFSGTGFGYNSGAASTDPLLTATAPALIPGVTETEWLYALTPNPTAFQPNALLNYTDPAGPGGANEDYDLPDYQNMLPAMQIPEAITGPLPIPAGTTPLPSLHRPELVNYWFHQLPGILDDVMGTTSTFTNGSDARRRVWFANPSATVGGFSLPPLERWTIMALKRRILLRPLAEYHANFDGGNSAFYPLWDGVSPFVPYDMNYDGTVAAGEGFSPRWDVDNDGDAIPDSIWVDVGLPVRSMKDGRLYKPLVAILCTDLDGRLNVNAHGNLAQTDATYYNQVTIPAATYRFAGNVDTAQLGRGQACGPAEVNLGALFGMGGANAEYASLLTGTTLGGGQRLPGRYGWPGDATPGWDVNPVARGNVRTPQSNNLLPDYPNTCDAATVAANSALAMSYGSPMDLKGIVAVGLDPTGQPLYYHPYAWANETVDQPYELDLGRDAARSLSRNQPTDNPFSVAELERVLRMYDGDAANLPDRLARLAPSLVDGPRRHEVTTESRSLPCPAVAWTVKLREARNANPSYVNGRFVPAHVTDLLLARGVPSASLGSLLAPELMSGLRMDLNRPFGNGVDEPPYNRVVDEPPRVIRNGANNDFIIDAGAVGEMERNERTANAAGGFIPAATLGYLDLCRGIDVNQDGNPNGANNEAADRAMARQLYARHLYVQMLLLIGYEGGLTAPDKDVARQVAQWAVNVVDFRDRDAIMTPFEYDIDPFHDNDGSPNNTWDVDGVVDRDPKPAATDDDQAHRGLVWGGERPELLITETLAFHDRRTEDLNTEAQIPPNEPDDPEDTANGDLDFDSRRKPEGSLFVELYNPWTNQEPPPGEFYDATYGGVDLTKRTPGSSPVWRLAIVPAVDADKDPDDLGTGAASIVERSVYFVDASGFADPDNAAKFYPSAPNRIAPVKPGRYAVVGPGSRSKHHPTTTFMGKFPSPPQAAPTDERRIVLDPDSDPDCATPQVQAWSDGQNPDLTPFDPSNYTDRDVQRPTAVVIDEPRRLSVSEPTGVDYYDVDETPLPNPHIYNPLTETYDKPYDMPQDKKKQPALWQNVLSKNGMHLRFAVVHLQRLANPLQDFDAELNPYRTIDSTRIDLTTFNGVAKPTPTSDENGNAPEKKNFISRERGENEENAKGVPQRTANNLWTGDPILDPKSPPKGRETKTPVAMAAHFSPYPFSHTLGYLNEGYQYDPPGAGAPGYRWQTKKTFDPNLPVQYIGAPLNPFPWFTWLNRPFANEMEIMLTPKERSSRMLQNFVEPIAGDPYDADAAKWPFKHVINFFYQDPSPGPTNPDWALYRLLDLVRVPSRFVGSRLQGDPATFAAAGGNHSFGPPFNGFSQRRDPGLVNLNTITSQRVWRGLFDFSPGATAWTDFVRSRRGYNATDWFVMNDQLPTRFANPFRSAAGRYLVPMDLLQTVVDSEVNATLLRQHPTSAGDPLFRFASAASYNKSVPNPYFRHQWLQRLGGTTTTRSNVYAVWITVGFFEVEPHRWTASPVNPSVNAEGLTPVEFPLVYPEGYRLGREMGADSGETRRHRGFFILDRSVPVGFQRGEDHNVEDAVLLRRYIE
ncbi:MAG: hypothetical protein JW809_09415 [Pirellulales bacterium]|nr:hypothetical protein [Pirellulales bacterium]